MARKAIDEFGEEKYNHYSDKSVSRRYVGPAMNKYGEHSEESVWVNYKTYEPLDEETLTRWKNILREEHLSNKEIVDAFFHQAEDEGAEIKNKSKAYKKALDRIKNELHILPIYVYK